LKPHVWDVQLTERGLKDVEGGRYAHEHKNDCDQWKVSFPQAKVDHVDVTGIVEDGVHAKVGAIIAFALTPVGVAFIKLLPALGGDNTNKLIDAQTARKYLDQQSPKDDAFAKRNATFEFEKYDDGWKPTQRHQ
jgi:hypothetical protein